MKLRSHVLIIAAATLLPIIAIVCFAIVLLFQKGRDIELDHLVDTARALSLAVDRDFEIGLASLRALGTNQELRTGDLRIFYDESKRALAVHEGAEAIILVDPSGQQIINTRLPYGEPLPQYGDLGFIKKVVESGRPTISNLFTGRIVQRPVISVGVPVIIDGRVRFALTLSLSPNSLQQLLVQQSITADSLGAIIDGNKIIVARSQEIEKYLGKPAGPRAIVKIAETVEGWWEGAPEGGHASFAAHHRSEFSGWTVIIDVPKTKVDAPLWHALHFVVGGVFLTLVVAFGLAIVFGRRITASIAALSAGAKALGSGQNVRIMPSPVFELDQVGQQLESAAAKRKEMEVSLRQSETRLRAIIDTEPECVKVMAPDGKLVEMNAAGLRMLQADSLAAIADKSLLDFVRPDYREAFVHLHQKVMSGENATLEFEIVGLKGQQRWLETHAAPLRDSAGWVTALLGVTRDITDRKRAEDALRMAHGELELRVEERTAELTRSNALLREKDQHLALAQRAGHAGLWSRDLATGMNSMSPEWHDLMGFPRKTESVSYAEFLNRVHPDDRQRVEELSLHQKIGDFDREFRIVHPIKGERWILSRGRRGISSEDGHLYMMGALIDITERKQTEEALRESEARLRSILDHHPAPVFIKDVSGKYVHVNRRFEELFGLDDAKCLGKTDAELFASEQAEAFQRNDRKVLDLGHAIQFEEMAQYYDGEHTSIVTKFPLLDTDGKIYALCGIATDITERKWAEEALLKLTEDLDRRVVERTRELAESRARLRALVAELSRAEERERRRLAVELHDYLAQMLTISRLKIGRANRLAADDAMKKRLAEAQESVDDSIAYTRTLMAQLSPRVLYDLGLPAALAWLAAQQKERHGIDVDVSGEAEAFALDEERSVLAYQCVRELLWNIVKHAETNQATVSYALEHGELTVEVADDGQGFDLESLHVNGNRVEKFGLFSIRERLELFGGKLEVTSQIGRGTRARFTMPAPQSEIAPVVTHNAVPVSAALGTGKRLSVALVDDHEVVRRGLRQLLEEFADLMVVGEAKDGLEGIRLARQFRPDVVVMDINMPGMNGIEATKRIIQEMPSTIVVGLSFESGKQVTQAMKAAGAFTCVTKERAMEDIHQAIVDAVEERQTLKMQNGELRMDNGR